MEPLVRRSEDNRPAAEKARGKRPGEGAREGGKKKPGTKTGLRRWPYRAAVILSLCHFVILSCVEVRRSAGTSPLRACPMERRRGVPIVAGRGVLPRRLRRGRSAASDGQGIELSAVRGLQRGGIGARGGCGIGTGCTPARAAHPGSSPKEEGGRVDARGIGRQLISTAAARARFAQCQPIGIIRDSSVEVREPAGRVR